MLSVVVVCGTLKENLTRGFRNICLDYFDVIQQENYVSCIPIIYWTREENNRINKYKDGTMVAIKGHLETDEEYGLCIVCESIHFTK